MKKSLTIFAILLAFGISANNIQVSNAVLVDQNTTDKTTMVKFDLSWENSWRTSTLESNWDAAWVFVKYKSINSIYWNHAYLNNTGHILPSGADIEIGLEMTNQAHNLNTNPAVGAMIFRDTDGIGNVNFEEIQLQWHYGSNGLGDEDSVQICVYAIEMVYIPEGAFSVGDNGTFSSNFIRSGNTTNPFLITSEGSLQTSTSDPSRINVPGVSNNSTIPANFPKGYQAFYTMKYEISQGLYKEFLNKLNRQQQWSNSSANRFTSATVGRFMSAATNTTTPSARNGIKLISDPGGFEPRVYGCDLNNNGTPDEADDGEHIACNFLSVYDLLALADWSGLRPMSELEYEKICRGPIPPVDGEFAWGNTTFIEYATSILNSGAANELTAPSTANVNLDNNLGGPIRVGSFARTTTDRIEAGASYYGVMNLSDNLAEIYRPVNNTNNLNGHRHGDGELNNSGGLSLHNVPTNSSGWGNLSSTERYGTRGGSYNISGASIASQATVSARNNAQTMSSTTFSLTISSRFASRMNNRGGRLGRTAN